jgi:CHAD domain-containing protein
MKEFVRYGDLHFKKLKKYLIEYKNLPQQETLHEVRVELKKLKVLFYLIEYCDESFNAKKEYKSLNKIFKKAGKIREIDVMESLIIKYNIKNIKGIASIKEKGKLINEFIERIPRFKDTALKKENDLKKYLAKVDEKCYLKYSKQKEKALKNELFPKINLKKLHVVRKKIKEIVYLKDLNDKENGKLKNLSKMENTIGSWHDKQMVLALLNKDNIKLHNLLVNKIKTEADKDIRVIKAILPTIPLPL